MRLISKVLTLPTSLINPSRCTSKYERSYELPDASFAPAFVVDAPPPFVDVKNVEARDMLARDLMAMWDTGVMRGWGERRDIAL